MVWRPRNKYNNKITRYNGVSYHSKLEADYCAHLDLLQKAGEIQNYEQQKIFRLEVNGKLICKIIPDFFVIGKYGNEEVHEIKSYATITPVFRVKWKLMQALYPEYNYKIIQKGDFQ